MSGQDVSAQTLAILTVALTSGTAVAGFLGRACYQSISGVREARRQRRLTHVEFLLGEFYVPIYLALKREHRVWGKIARHEHGALLHQLDASNLQTHLEVRNIITSKLAQAAPRADLMDALTRFDEHVTIYKALRDAGRSDFPRSLDCPYPGDLMPKLASRIRELEAERDRLHGFCPDAPHCAASQGCCVSGGCGGCSGCSKCGGCVVPNVVLDLEPGHPGQSGDQLAMGVLARTAETRTGNPEERPADLMGSTEGASGDIETGERV